MVVLRLRSPLTMASLFAAGLILGALALFRVETEWRVSVEEVAVSGEWGVAPGEFGRGTGADGRSRGPQAFAVDAAGNIAVADSLNYRVEIFGREGKLLEVFPVPAGMTSPRSEAERSSTFGLLQPCLGWASDFRPEPDLAGPASPWLRPVTTEGQPPGLRPAYITDLDLTEGAWRTDPGSGRLDPAGGPEIRLLAGWEGVVAATDPAGTLRWSRDLSTPPRFLAHPDWSKPIPENPPRLWAGYLADLDTLPGGGALVTGYSLEPERLVFFVRALPGSGAEPRDLASYELVRDGTVKVDTALPIAQEVESACVGWDGLLYLAAAPPVPSDDGAVGPGGTPGGKLSPFTRDLYVYTPEPRPKGKLTLECESYTRYLRLVGVDGRGLIYARLGGVGLPPSYGVFDGRGRLVASLAFPEGAELADAYLGRDGALHVSAATDEGYRVARYHVGRARRLRPRWAGWR